MLRVKLSHPFPGSQINRQTPGRSGIWGDCQFFINEPVEACDAWVVIEGLGVPSEKTTCSPSRTIFISAEPPDEYRYSEKFLGQFGAVVVGQKTRHPHVLRRQQALPWWVGQRMSGHNIESIELDYDSLAQQKVFPKTRNVSIICSKVDKVSGHRRRLNFVRQLQEAFPDGTIDFFGRDTKPAADKYEAIAPYRYHIAIENGSWPHYWTEKLADAYLGGALPIYAGCPNIDRYFPDDAMIRIDISRPREAIQKIRNALTDRLYEARLEQIQKARELVLNRYNLFPELSSLIHELPASDAAPIEISWLQKVGFSAKETFRRRMHYMTNNSVRVLFRLKNRLLHRGS